MLTAIQWKDLFKFFAGGFFVIAALSIYLYLASFSITNLSTGVTVTHNGMCIHSIIYSILFIVFFYLGFFRWRNG